MSIPATLNPSKIGGFWLLIALLAQTFCHIITLKQGIRADFCSLLLGTWIVKVHRAPQNFSVSFLHAFRIADSFCLLRPHSICARARIKIYNTSCFPFVAPTVPAPISIIPLSRNSPIRKGRTRYYSSLVTCVGTPRARSARPCRALLLPISAFTLRVAGVTCVTQSILTTASALPQTSVDKMAFPFRRKESLSFFTRAKWTNRLGLGWYKELGFLAIRLWDGLKEPKVCIAYPLLKSRHPHLLRFHGLPTKSLPSMQWREAETSQNNYPFLFIRALSFAYELFNMNCKLRPKLPYSSLFALSVTLGCLNPFSS